MAGGDGAAQLRLVVPLEEDLLAAGLGRVPLRGEAADDVMDEGPRRDVGDVDVRRGGEARIERDPDQAALPEAVDLELEKRLGEEAVALHHPEGPRLFADEDPAVGGDRQGRRAGESPGDPLLEEAVREVGRLLDRRRDGGQEEGLKRRKTHVAHPSLWIVPPQPYSKSESNSSGRRVTAAREGRSPVPGAASRSRDGPCPRGRGSHSGPSGARPGRSGRPGRGSRAAPRRRSAAGVH